MIYLSQAYVYFILFGEKFSPSDLTNHIGIKPTDIGLIGEKRKSGAILKESFWKYQLKKTDALEGIEKSLLEWLEIFSDRINLLKDFMIKNKLKSKCFIVIESQNGENNGVSLSSEFIDFLHELNTSIEIDIYPK